MLQEIRDKVHGVFASVILVFICVLFGLWGIQNYLGGGKEAPIVSVGDKEFFQNDVNDAYQKYLQSLGGMKFDEETIRKQALAALVRDEVLWQYVHKENLVISDETAMDFIKSLPYFQTDGKFDKAKLQSQINSQRTSSDEFFNEIKKHLLMVQVKGSIIDSSFVTAAEVANYFKILNQKRDVEYLSLPLVPVAEKLSDEEISAYYQQHQEAYQSEEQVSIEYVELALDKLAAEVKPTEEQLKAYYEEQKSQFATKERRRISHILFAFTKDTSADEQALQRAKKAKEELKSKDFAQVAAEISDDKSSAKKGGDLGLFEAGIMEKAFEAAVESLKLGEVSEPVKTAFGYHLIKVTELSPAEVKTFDELKPVLVKAYQKSQAETKFNALGEKLTEVSFEHPDNLDAAAKILGVEISKTGMFTHGHGEGVASEEKVRLAAFSEDVLKGNNSEPIEIGNDKLVVLRMQSHQASASKELKDVKPQVISAIQQEKAKQQLAEKASKLRAELAEGKPIEQLAEANHLPLKKLNGLIRSATDLPPPVMQAVFKAPKPEAGRTSALEVDEPTGGKVVVHIVKVTEGEISDADKAKLPALQKNIAAAFGKAQFEAAINALQSKADVKFHPQKQ